MYRGFTAALLKRMRIESIHSEGYSAVSHLHHVAELTIVSPRSRFIREPRGGVVEIWSRRSTRPH
jgi:hypothetical protein